MNTTMLNSDFRILIETVFSGGELCAEDRRLLSSYLKRALCSRAFMDAYWGLIECFPRSEEALSADSLEQAAVFGLEQLENRELLMLVRDRFELLSLRDRIFERLRDPEVELDGDDYWLSALWDESEPINTTDRNRGETEVKVADLMAFGPPPVAMGEKALAAKAGGESSFSFLTFLEVAGVRCEVYEKDGRAFLKPLAQCKPRNLTIGEHRCEVHEHKTSGCFEIQGVTPDVVIKIASGIKTNPRSYTCNADWDK